MKATKSNLHPFRSGSAIIASLALFSMATPAEAAFYLAFGVDTLETSPNFNQIRVRDVHGDHYHNYTENNGVGSRPQPLTLVPGSGFASIELGAMEISPFAQARYKTELTPSGDFHLELVALSGVGTHNLIVRFWHGDHTHTMSVGGDEHLELDEIYKIDFSLPSDAALGSYSAQFMIIDEDGNYSDSPLFTVHVNAIPEPSTALLGATALFLGLLRRRRA